MRPTTRVRPRPGVEPTRRLGWSPMRSRHPKDWDEERVQRVLAHYETQTELEAVAEDEAAYESPDEPLVSVPRELVSAVRELIAKHRK